MANTTIEAPLADELLDGGEAISQFTGISRTRVFYLAERGLLPVFKVGSRWCALKKRITGRPEKPNRWGSRGAMPLKDGAGSDSAATESGARKIVGTGERRESSKPFHHCPQAWALHYGSARSPLAAVVPDARWLGMYRLAWPDGQRSDMVNISRAKDAAGAICERGPPERNRRVFHWKLHTSKTLAGTSLARRAAEPALIQRQVSIARVCGGAS
jgi:hypothetical protein